VKKDATALPRLNAIDRQQLVLRTVDVEKLIDDDHSARAIWELVGRLDLSLYYSQIAAVEGQPGREHTDPQLLISVWIYAYSRGISSAREVARQCEFEPAFQWLCGLQPISHRTLSGFRSEYKAALDDLFVQVLGMLSAEGLITMERVTLDGTKIKANAGGNTFRRREKIEAHLALAREQVRLLDTQAAEEEKMAKRQAAARRRAARQRVSRAGGGSPRGGAAATGEEARSKRFCSSRFQHGSGSTCNAERRGRHGAELQPTTTHGYAARVGGERGSYHGRD
jgi:transposase